MTNADGVNKFLDQTAATDTVNAKFLAMLGKRVRWARAKRTLSRQALSEMSGISLRYLAQLESGKGNVSVSLLLKIANALDIDLSDLVAADERSDSSSAGLYHMFNQATPVQRQMALEALRTVAPLDLRAGRIALIGLRGAGKSTLGRLAAAEMDLPFLELDQEIESASGMPVNEVFSLYGQDVYRRLERQALEKIAESHDSLILAVAGGIVTDLETYAYCLQNFRTIWLKAPPEEHMARVRKQGDERPMSGNPDAMNDLRRILKSRETQYSKAQAIVDTSGCDVVESLQFLLAAIRKLQA
ncbi:MAG: helix-turn-helix transcriptional regulator [Proteobacteria bacterium]|nr:helix-turn-helix transcriptional regulator [Pseudomonadota bacterium]MDA1286662.1 helix-turn-helix transcriptional regulator [Pseudomonadota bacterium]